ncbi:MAG TPA: hypothetical protein VGF67_12310 [Ktedonobacteraceae bacterium]|jgi:hypothetical protein
MMLFKKGSLDLQTSALFFLLLLFLSGVMILYFTATPHSVEYGPDTYGYLAVLQQLRTSGNPVNAFRLPTYPLFLLIMTFFFHRENLLAASLFQGWLFVCATGEIAVLTLLLTQKRWLACVVAVVVGTNIYLLSDCKLIMTEGLSLWLLTTTMLSAVLFLKTLRVRFLLLCAGLLLFLLFTRPEWVLFPGVLFPLLFFATRKRLAARVVLLSAGASLIVMALLIGGYIAANARLNHFASLSSVTNMNLIGKVLQYRMQDETPSNAALSQIYDSYLQRGIRSPYYITAHAPGLGENYAQASADWAKAILLHHPGEFLGKSLPYFFTSLTLLPPASIPPLHGAFAPLLTLLSRIQLRLVLINSLFPLCALFWLVLCCLKRTRSLWQVQALGVLVLTICYAVGVTTLGGYTESDYARVHVVFDPLIALVVWGSLGLGVSLLASTLRRST